MTLRQIREKYLDLFNKSWDDPTLIDDLRPLRDAAVKAELPFWRDIIDARIARNEKRFDDALAIIDTILKTDPKNPHGFLLKGLILRDMPDLREEAIVVLRHATENAGNLHEVVPRHIWVIAKSNIAGLLHRLERYPDALVIHDEIIDRLKKSRSTKFQTLMTEEMLCKALTMKHIEDIEKEVSVCDELIGRFCDSEHLSILENVAQAMFIKGVRYGELGRNEDAVTAYDKLIDWSRKYKESTIQELATKAMYNKGATLEYLGACHKATVVYKKITTLFAKSEIPDVIKSVALSWTSLAIIHKNNGNESEADIAIRKAIDYAIKSNKLSSELLVVLSFLTLTFDDEKRREYVEKIEAGKTRTKLFTSKQSRFHKNRSFIMILREWNSFTPKVPSDGEQDRGGGYFIQHDGRGIVVDPGYDFIQQFHRAGGRIDDITDIVITHAHPDHTAELEDLLMLIHVDNKEKKKECKKTGTVFVPKRISLYLSQGTQRKFSGLIHLPDDSKIDHVVTLSRPEPGSSQTIKISEKITLTVLPAYHDDVITHDTAVGLGFEFKVEGGSRKVVFTGDTGYYPCAYGSTGNAEYYDSEAKNPKLDTERPLSKAYPKKFRKKAKEPVDLLILHIGSIIEKELEPLRSVLIKDDDEGKLYYDNHLGLLGSLAMLSTISPKAAFISEFGSELRGIHLELVKILADALEQHQNYPTANKIQTKVFPGDITMVYYIDEDKFLCHSDSTTRPAEELVFDEYGEYEVSIPKGEDEIPEFHSTGTRRAYLNHKNASKSKRGRGIRDYYEHLALKTDLPHFPESEDAKKEREDNEEGLSENP